jgi:hypothetical protein
MSFHDDPDYVVQGLYKGQWGGVAEQDGSNDIVDAVHKALAMKRSSHFEGDYVRVITRDGESVYDTSRGEGAKGITSSYPGDVKQIKKIFAKPRRSR